MVAVAPIHLLLLNAQYEICPYFDDAVSRARVLTKVSAPCAVFRLPSSFARRTGLAPPSILPWTPPFIRGAACSNCVPKEIEVSVRCRMAKFGTKSL